MERVGVSIKMVLMSGTPQMNKEVGIGPVSCETDCEVQQ